MSLALRGLRASTLLTPPPPTPPPVQERYETEKEHGVGAAADADEGADEE